ncbi:S41 family peptidase [Ornithinibacillus californiensis]|uniref:S41 family peptidase n=1 Tax=Ornithinibacillus californiensis TaxID=161536 RepID=UPI00064D7DEB|nr:S41 family peptidase [Ornithinibacillus californiensis]
MYSDIFREVVDIMHSDYAGYKDKQGWDNPKVYEDKIRQLENTNELTPNRFTELVQDYLLDFKDPHMFFIVQKSETQQLYDNGFKVRRHEDKLFVTSTGNESRLKVGDAIVELDNVPVLALVEKHKRELMESKAERESWRDIIKKYNLAKVVDRTGKEQIIELKKYPKEGYVANHSITRIDEDTLCMTLTDFFNPDPLNQLIEKHKKELSKTVNLIIDVRINNGGSDATFQNLTPYLFPTNPIILDYSDYQMKFNCTERNASSQINSLKEDLNQITDPTIQNMIKQFIQMWEKHRGSGFVAFESQNMEAEIVGLEYPKNIIILADVYCGSAGDIFVNLCKQSPKVTVVGRATMGMNDYANLTTITWNNQLKFMYPTSRLDQLDHRGALEEPGIKPDIYIPWAPEHIEKDIDMETAMNILQRV